MKKRIFRWIKILVVIYCVVGITFYYLQDKLLFRPQPLLAGEQYHFRSPFIEVNIPFNQSSNLNIIQFPTTGKTKGVVLYFHGNRKNIGHYENFVPDFTNNGYEVWMMDYPGYGKSTGEFSEQRIYDWALLLYKLSRKRFSPDSIVIYGKSMGSGIAAQLASVRDTRRLILETPYYSFPSVIGQYAPVYPWNKMIHFKVPTYQYLQRVTAPVTIFQGTADGVIRHSNASSLKPFLKPGDEFISIEGGSHNDLHSFNLFRQKLDSVLSR